MNAEELAEATREFDKPLPRGRARTMTRSERALWEQARRGGSGKKTKERAGHPKETLVAVRLDAELVEKSDRLAKQRGLTRAQIIERGLKGLLAFTE